MLDKKFNEWLESVLPRPGAGSYPALPIEPAELKLQKTKGKRGAPIKREISLKQIEKVLSRYDVSTRSLGYLLDRIAESTPLKYKNLDRNFKKDIRKIIARMKGDAKNT